MSFWRYLQSQSQSIKAYYALCIASVSTGLIAIVWISTIPARFAEISPKEESVNTEESQSFTELFDTTKGQLGNVIDGVKEIQNLEEVVNIETQNMDNLSRDEISNETPSQISNGSSGVITPKSPTPVVIKSKPSVVLIEERKSVPKEEPRVIIIGTTTNQSSN